MREAEELLEAGADELDMVISIGRFLQGDEQYVRDEIEQLVVSAGAVPVKVIIECCYLTRQQMERATELVVAAGAAYVKTSTGFGPSGAALEDVNDLVRWSAGRIKVKAAGGIRSLEDALAFVNAGAVRIGLQLQCQDHAGVEALPAADQVQQFQRVVLIVLDGVGVGELPDADQYGDRGAATLQHVARHAGGLTVPTLESLGLGRIAEFEGVGVPLLVRGCWGKMAEASAGKDSVTGHWELAGLQLDQPFAVFPDGFPDEIIDAFSLLAGCRPLGNIRFQRGTDILELLGEEHLRTGRPIVYTSIDSVFSDCRSRRGPAPRTALRNYAWQLLTCLRPYNICRVIARPFLGDRPENFYRTSRRHDYSQKPVRPTLLKRLCEQGITTCGIGKNPRSFCR